MSAGLVCFGWALYDLIALLCITFIASLALPIFNVISEMCVWNHA